MKSLFASNRTKSASAPAFKIPFFPVNPICAAGLADSQSTTFESEMPLFEASVCINESPNPNPPIPPQAVLKSPVSSVLSSATQGEWSETTKSMSPANKADQSWSRLESLRMGGQHLKSVRPSGILSALKHTAAGVMSAMSCFLTKDIEETTTYGSESKSRQIMASPSLWRVAKLAEPMPR